MSAQPRGVRIAYGSPLLLCLSSNTQKTPGVFVPMINRTSLSSMLGKLMSARCGHCLASSSEGMLRLEAFNLSTVHSLFTSILSVRSRGSTVKLISLPNLGFSEKIVSAGLEFQAPSLDSCHIRRHLTQCQEEPTFSQSCLSHFFAPSQELFTGSLFLLLSLEDNCD